MLPVLFVLALVGWAYYVYMALLMLPQMQHKAVSVITSIIFMHIALILFMTSFLRTVFGNPGTIPASFPQGYDGGPLLECKSEGSLRQCSKCQKTKPDRSHHCSICEKCVLKMDHHCPWVNNCVGWGNYKFFILFLTYTVVLCLVIAITSIPWILEHFTIDSLIGTKIQIVLMFFAATIFGLGLLLFAGQHYRLVFMNMTTIESLERTRPISWSASTSTGNRREMGIVKQPYNLGWKNNFCQVFGASPFLWFLPIQNSVGDGISFPVRRQTPDDLLEP